MKIDKIIRSQRKTIAIIVQRDGTVIVRAPKSVTNLQIQNFVEIKADWIKEKQAEALRRQLRIKPKQFINGETFLFLGCAYPLEFVDQARPSLILSEGRFLLAKSAQPKAKDIFVNWYIKQARQVLNERVSLYAAQFHLSYKKIRIGSARTRWGSCSSLGTLSFTWRLVMAPLPVIDYVVIHELAHIAEENHSKRFWGKVGEMLTDYSKYETWLKSNGYQLTLE